MYKRQLIRDPKILPAEAKNNNKNGLYLLDNNSADKYVSEAKGKKVPKDKQKINNDE